MYSEEDEQSLGGERTGRRGGIGSFHVPVCILIWQTLSHSMTKKTWYEPYVLHLCCGCFYIPFL